MADTLWTPCRDRPSLFTFWEASTRWALGCLGLMSCWAQDGGVPKWPELGLDTPQKVLGLATGPGTVLGSEFGSHVVLQQYSHIQQCLLQMLGQVLGAGLSAAVVSRHGEVDVGFPGIITHTIAIRDHGPKEHDTVGLGRDLEGRE